MEDLPAVLQVERGCVTAPHWRPEEYRRIFSVADVVTRCLFVAERDGVVVGFAVGSLSAGEGELESVAVEEKARRLGLGRKLVACVLEWCGDAVVRLEVRMGSLDAIELYRGCGFVVAGVRKGYYADPAEDALVMVRESYR